MYLFVTRNILLPKYFPQIHTSVAGTYFFFSDHHASLVPHNGNLKMIHIILYAFDHSSEPMEMYAGQNT